MNMFRSVMNKKAQLGVLVGLVTVGFGALLTGCIAGPPPCGADGASSTASSDSSSSSSASDVTKVPVPPGVVPTGVAITDPSTAAVTNIDPPGGWFMMNDHSPKGSMTPETNGDFASVTKDGLVHTDGKMYTD